MERSPKPPIAFGADLREKWMLKAGVAFLNHGSFGALPRAVLRHQRHWQGKVEAEPVEYLSRRYSDVMDDTKRAVGEWLHMSPADFGLVSNVTEGVASVLSSLKLSGGDELVTTNHVYNAVRQAMRRTTHQWNAAYREIQVPTPLNNSDEIARRILGGLTERTKLLILDHVTSPTALIFPVAQIAKACSERGIEVLIDGAHAPGMLDLDVPSIGATYYTGNLHKWACCPRSVGFLWTRPDRQPQTHPAIISHAYGQSYAAEFEWLGTRDPSPWLSVPAALRFMSKLGWPDIYNHNRALARWAQQMLGERWNVEPLTQNPQILGSMATVPLPGDLGTMTEDQSRAFQRRLYHQHRIEVPLMRWQERWHIRVSCHVYNTPEDYERLAQAILKEHPPPP